MNKATLLVAIMMGFAYLNAEAYAADNSKKVLNAKVEKLNPKMAVAYMEASAKNKVGKAALTAALVNTNLLKIITAILNNGDTMDKPKMLSIAKTESSGITAADLKQFYIDAGKVLKAQIQLPEGSTDIIDLNITKNVGKMTELIKVLSELDASQS